MTARKKKGVASLISGGLFLGVGIVLLATTATPDWVGLGMNIIGAVANILGFILVYPDAT